MKVRTLDSNGDFTFGAGLNNYATNQIAAQLLLRMNLLSFYGDCFFDVNAGIPWLQYLGTTGQTNQLSLNLAVSAAILNTHDENGNPLVTGINQLNIGLNRQTRQLSIQYEVVTIYSVVTSEFIYDIGVSA